MSSSIEENFENMGGWRSIEHKYKCRYRTYLDVFFTTKKKFRMWVDGVLLNANTNADIGRIQMFFTTKKKKNLECGWMASY